jgi:hypothetical protein
MKLIISLFVVISILVSVTHCYVLNGPNSELNTVCEGQNESVPACVPTVRLCQQKNLTEPSNAKCITGRDCYCNPGFLRDVLGGKCIPISQCP